MDGGGWVALLIGAVLGTGGLVQLWNARQLREAADRDRDQQWLLAREERDHQRAMVEAEHEHQRSVAHDERTFVARSEAYIGLMEMFTKRMHDVFQVNPLLDRPAGEWVQMSAAEESLVLARVSAHGSPEMNALIEEWGEHSARWRAHRDTIASVEARAEDAGEWRVKLLEERDAMDQVVRSIEVQARTELAGRSAGIGD
jgi:hypothetical protein